MAIFLEVTLCYPHFVDYAIGTEYMRINSGNECQISGCRKLGKYVANVEVTRKGD